MENLIIYKVLAVTPNVEKFQTVNETGLTFPVFGRVPLFYRKGKQFIQQHVMKEGEIISGKAYTFEFTNGKKGSFVRISPKTFISIKNLRDIYSNADGETSEVEDKESAMLESVRGKVDELKKDKDHQKYLAIGVLSGLVAGILLSKVVPCCKFITIAGGVIVGGVVSEKIFDSKHKEVAAQTNLPSADAIAGLVEEITAKSGTMYTQQTINKLKSWYATMPDNKKRALSDMLVSIKKSQDLPKEQRADFIMNELTQLANRDGVEVYENIKYEMTKRQININ